MNIIEVKNNLVKLNYEEDITLSSFVKISDVTNTYIAQILHLEASRIGKVAVARLIFNYKGSIQAYDGSVPSIQAIVEPLDDDFFLNTLDSTDPLVLGKLIHRNNDVIISAKLLKDKPVICAEKSYQYALLIENMLKQNEENNRKTVVIDTTGDIRGNKIVATKDFKMPLNQYSIDYIFDRGFEDATPENKAFIQDIFSELNDYIKTVDYIPFNDFNKVIDYEFKRTQLLQLIMLKNRLTEFEKKGIFANKDDDFKILENKLKEDNTIIVDISKLNDSIQTEYIEYVYSEMEKQSSNFYSIVCLNNNNSSKSTLNTLFGAKNIFTSIVCPYSYKYMTELKQCSKNMFMFTPIKQQSDFGVYNIFVNKIAEDEFILYGKSTKFTPLIIKLEEVNEFPIYHTETVNEDVITIPEIKQEPISDSSIISEINDAVEEIDDEINEEITVLETISEESIVNSEPAVEQNQDYEINPETEFQPNIEEFEEISPIINEEEAPTVIEETDNTELIQEIEETPIITEVKEEVIETLDVEEKIDSTAEEPAIETQTKEIEIKDQMEDMNFDIDIADDEIASVLSKIENNIQEEPTPAEEQEINSSEQENTESEEDLTDEDLDMIDSLQIEQPMFEEPLDNEITDTENSINIEDTIGEEITNNDIPNLLNEPEEQNEQLEDNLQEDEDKTPSITDEILMEEAKRKALEEANRPDPIEEQIEKPSSKVKEQALETKESTTPIVPVYSAEIPDEDLVESDPLGQGDTVHHDEFGKGVIEKIINYGERELYSINFEDAGRKLLDPKISELKKI